MNILPLTPGVSKLGTASAQYAEVNALAVKINGVDAATVGRATDAFGALTDITTNDATTLKHGFMSKADKIKLDTIASGAQVNPTDAAIATSYAAIVPQVSAPEITAATSTAIRRYSPADIAAIANVRIAASAGGLDTAAVVSAVSTATANTDTIAKTLDTGVLTYNVRRKSSGLTSGSEGLIGSDSSGLFVTLGNTGNTALAGNDARLLTTDEKAAVTASAAPAAGNPFMTATGARSIKLDDFAAPDDNTDLDATTSAHGLMSKNDKIALDALPTRATDTFGPLTDITTNDATTLKHGFMSKADKIALDALPTRATDAFGPLTDITTNDATTLKHGFMSKADKIKLDSITVGGSNAKIVIQHNATDGTSGGTATAGSWQTRPLSFKPVDTDAICTLASNEFTLPAGTFDVEAVAQGYKVGGFKLRLYNTTATATVNGIAAVCGSSAAADSVVSHAFISGRFTLAAPAVLRLEQRVNTTRATDGMGIAASIGEPEVFASITLTKVG
jgi:hypothetical protein